MFENIERILIMKREISGFGGGYERTCRDMLIAGLKWCNEHPNASPQFQGYQGVFGLIEETNDDAKQLSKAVTEGNDCTGAMYHAVIGTIFWIRANGIDAYLEEMNREIKG